jgi:aldos-2-ulose dehydratase
MKSYVLSAYVLTASLTCHLQDIATISYSVPGYFESPNPSINVFFSTGILADKLDEEVSFRVTRAGSTRFKTEMEFLDVSGRKMSLVVLPPGFSLSVQNNVSGVKVMAGTVHWFDAESNRHERVPATRPFTAESMIVRADRLESGEEGAIFVHFKPSASSGTPPFSSMEQLKAHNLFPPYVSDDVQGMTFPWVKCQDRPWAHGRFKVRTSNVCHLSSSTLSCRA